MSQREKLGFNWYRAVLPISTRPETPVLAASADNAPPAWFGPPLLPSEARGVFHPEIQARACIDKSVITGFFETPAAIFRARCFSGSPS